MDKNEEEDDSSEVANPFLREEISVYDERDVASRLHEQITSIIKRPSPHIYINADKKEDNIDGIYKVAKALSVSYKVASLVGVEVVMEMLHTTLQAYTEMGDTGLLPHLYASGAYVIAILAAGRYRRFPFHSFPFA